MTNDHVHIFDFKDSEKDGYRFAGKEMQRHLAAIHKVLASFSPPHQIANEDLHPLYNATLGKKFYDALPTDVQQAIDHIATTDRQEILVLKGVMPIGKIKNDHKGAPAPQHLRHNINKTLNAFLGMLEARFYKSFATSKNYPNNPPKKYSHEDVEKLTEKTLSEQLDTMNVARGEDPQLPERILVVEEDALHLHKTKFTMLATQYGNQSAHLQYFLDDDIAKHMDDALSPEIIQKMLVEYNHRNKNTLLSDIFQDPSGYSPDFQEGDTQEQVEKARKAILADPSYDIVLQQGDVVVTSGDPLHRRTAFIGKGNDGVERFLNAYFAQSAKDNYQFTEEELQKGLEMFYHPPPERTR